MVQIETRREKGENKTEERLERDLRVAREHTLLATPTPANIDRNRSTFGHLLTLWSAFGFWDSGFSFQVSGVRNSSFWSRDSGLSNFVDNAQV